MSWTMQGYKARKNGRTCVNCMYYDGEICTLDIESTDIDNVIDTFGGRYVAPFNSCDYFEESFEETEEEE